MAIYQKYLPLLDKVSILFIPSFNVDGLARFGPYNRINQNGPLQMGWRTNSQNLNLNRDYMKADSPEMKAWLDLFHHYLPDLLIDCHTTDGADYQYVVTYSLETFGNMDSGLTGWVKDYYEPQLKKRMAQKAMPIFPYVSFKQWHNPRSGLKRSVGTPMISQGYAALQNRIGLLIETHMLKPYEPRVFATKEMILASLEMMNAQAENLKDLNLKADALMSSKKQGPTELCIAYETDMSDTTQVEFLGIEYDMIISDLTGGEWFRYSDKPATFEIDLFEKQIEKEKVALPYAYIIPVEQQKAQEVIKSHHIAYEITDKKQEIEVETYQFSQQKWAATSFEGHQNLQSFDAALLSRKTTYEAGAMVVPVQQRTLKVLTYLLEPKADNSLVSWGFFNASMERKEYVETYVMEKMAREMIADNPSLKTEFETWKKENPQQAQSHWLQCFWFYERTPYWDEKKDIYPVGRIMNKELLEF
ncbi:MAG: peptidase M14 [Bacteroidetes bacterium 4572_77]|nr:MAG: peptidase M14 [Bacteroidetes bacterium 4572_77]